MCSHGGLRHLLHRRGFFIALIAPSPEDFDKLITFSPSKNPEYCPLCHLWISANLLLIFSLFKMPHKTSKPLKFGPFLCFIYEIS
jgi:hypothetical protein